MDVTAYAYPRIRPRFLFHRWSLHNVFLSFLFFWWGTKFHCHKKLKYNKKRQKQRKETPSYNLPAQEQQTRIIPPKPKKDLPCMHQQDRIYTGAEGGHCPPTHKKKNSIKKLRFALIYIYICLSSSKIFRY